MQSMEVVNLPLVVMCILESPFISKDDNLVHCFIESCVRGTHHHNTLYVVPGTLLEQWPLMR